MSVAALHPPRGWPLATAAKLAAAGAVLAATSVFFVDSPLRRWAAESPYTAFLKLQAGPPELHTAAAAPLPAGARVVAFGIADVEGGEIRLAPAVPGVVEEVVASEGARVVKGQPLLRLRTVAAEQKLAVAKEVFKQAKLRLQTANRGPKLYLEKIKELEFEIEAAEEAVEAQRDELDNVKRLSAESVPAGRLRLEDRKLTIAEAKLDAVKRQLEQAKLRDPSEDVASAESDVAKANAQIREAEETLAQHTLRAPEAGVVLRVLTAPGQVVASGLAPALLMRPSRPLVLRCEVNQEFAERVAEGQTATIYNDKLDESVGVGRVRRLADWIAPRRSQLDEPFERNDVRTLEAIVEFVGERPNIRQGQRLRVVFGTE